MGHLKVNKVIISLVLLIIFVILFTYLVDLGKIPEIISEANWRYIVLSGLLGIPGSFLGPFRLRELLRLIKGRLSVSYVWSLANMGALLSLIFPFSVGGFAMPYFLAKKIGSTYKKAFSVVLADAFFGLPMTLGLGGLALLYFFKKNLISLRVDSINLALPALFLFALFIVVFFLRKFSFFLKAVELVGKAVKFVSKSKNLLIKPILITLVMFITGSFQFYLYFLAFGMHPQITDFILAGSLLGLLAMIPSIVPMKIGQFETLGILTLPYLLGLDKNRVFVLLLAQRFVSIVVILTLGFISLQILKIDLSRLKYYGEGSKSS